MRIEKGVPMPPPRQQVTWPFYEMSVGDSFVLPTKENQRCKNAACSFERSHPGVKFLIRKLSAEESRIWRTQ